MATNPRYEGYSLNLKLRQRFLKGNFKCLIIGSLLNLTFPVTFLGSNLRIIKTITEGNNFRCQDLKFSKNPFLIYNNEFLKRNDGKNSSETLKILFYSHIFDKAWNGLNRLNSSLSDLGTLTLKQISHLKLKDLNNFSSLYFLNTTVHNISNLKKITELKLLKKWSKNNKKPLRYTLFIDQNQKINNNRGALNGIVENYKYVLSNTLYENEETFVNTEGFIKRTTKLVQKKQAKTNLQTLRKILKSWKAKITFLTKKDNKVIFFNTKKLYYFKNFINFQYYAVQNLTHLNFYFTIKNKAIAFTSLHFKSKTKKMINTKLKYWLDDFFTGGKDDYSQHSKILRQCSKNLRFDFINFRNC